MAKIYQHPGYPHLNIIEAQSASDFPQQGAFFVTEKNLVLSEIAKRAYGAPTAGSTYLTLTKRINRSRYNMAKCYYRRESGNCYSPRVSSELALSTNNWGAGAWLALCNVDRYGVDGLGLQLGTKYQVIWIPPASGEEPWDMPAPQNGPPAGGIDQPGFETKKPSLHIPGLDLDLNVEIGKGAKGIVVEDDPDEPPKGEPEPIPEPQKAGMGWIPAVVLGAGALVTVLVFAWKNKKKGKK